MTFFSLLYLCQVSILKFSQMSIMSAAFLENFSYFGRVQLFLRRWLRKKRIPTTLYEKTNETQSLKKSWNYDYEK